MSRAGDKKWTKKAKRQAELAREFPDVFGPKKLKIRLDILEWLKTGDSDHVKEIKDAK
jgi:hypothetical protein